MVLSNGRSSTASFARISMTTGAGHLQTHFQGCENSGFNAVEHHDRIKGNRYDSVKQMFAGSPLAFSNLSCRLMQSLNRVGLSNFSNCGSGP